MFKKLICMLGLAVLLSSAPAFAANSQAVKGSAVRFQSDDESHTGVKRTYKKAKHKVRHAVNKSTNTVKTQYNKAKNRVKTDDEKRDMQERK
jgi:hypothetical protein